jgi:MoaA/NifB/PqqE/SkfB family radical SAM enzyme
MPLTEYEQFKRDEIKKKKPLVYDKVLKYDEKFARGESIATIQIQYSWDCIFRCEHCSAETFRRKPEQRHLTVKDVKSLCDQADSLGLGHLYISGGEPLILPELDDLIEAIDPKRFYIEILTNGWVLDKDMAKHLAKIGVDKLQISLDSLNPQEHDKWRRQPGAFNQAMKAIDNSLKEGIYVQLATVVTHESIYSKGVHDLLEHFHDEDVDICFIPAAPVGEFEERWDLCLTAKDMEYMYNLRAKYPRITYHRLPAYGLDIGCLAVKRVISITPDGEVMPCLWIYASLGNILDTSLKEILDKGMAYFGTYEPACRWMKFPQLIKNTYGLEWPIQIEKVIDANPV